MELPWLTITEYRDHLCRSSLAGVSQRSSAEQRWAVLAWLSGCNITLTRHQWRHQQGETGSMLAMQVRPWTTWTTENSRMLLLQQADTWSAQAHGFMYTACVFLGTLDKGQTIPGMLDIMPAAWVPGKCILCAAWEVHAYICHSDGSGVSCGGGTNAALVQVWRRRRLMTHDHHRQQSALNITAVQACLPLCHSRRFPSW